MLYRNELFEGGCTDENYYGYPEAKPCIMVCIHIFSFQSETDDHYGLYPYNFISKWDMHNAYDHQSFSDQAKQNLCLGTNAISKREPGLNMILIIISNF